MQLRWPPSERLVATLTRLPMCPLASSSHVSHRNTASAVPHHHVHITPACPPPLLRLVAPRAESGFDKSRRQRRVVATSPAKVGRRRCASEQSAGPSPAVAPRYTPGLVQPYWPQMCQAQINKFSHWPTRFVARPEFREWDEQQPGATRRPQTRRRCARCKDRDRIPRLTACSGGERMQSNPGKHRILEQSRQSQKRDRVGAHAKRGTPSHPNRDWANGQNR